jgi:mersacidin/lichenicidin family type 2 lantibiotic
MNIQDIIRAWKDRNYRESLTEEQRALLPDNPIGEVLSQEELNSISGGFSTGGGPQTFAVCSESINVCHKTL